MSFLMMSCFSEKAGEGPLEMEEATLGYEAAEGRFQVAVVH